MSRLTADEMPVRIWVLTNFNPCWVHEKPERFPSVEYIRADHGRERRDAIRQRILDDHEPAQTPDGRRYILVPVEALNDALEYLRGDTQ